MLFVVSNHSPAGVASESSRRQQVRSGPSVFFTTKTTPPTTKMTPKTTSLGRRSSRIVLNQAAFLGAEMRCNCNSGAASGQLGANRGSRLSALGASNRVEKPNQQPSQQQVCSFGRTSDEGQLRAVAPAPAPDALRRLTSFCQLHSRSGTLTSRRPEPQFIMLQHER